MRPPELIFLLALRAKRLFLASPLRDGVEVLQRPRHEYLGIATDANGSIWVSLEFISPQPPFVLPATIAAAVVPPFRQQFQQRSPCILVFIIDPHRCPLSLPIIPPPISTSSSLLYCQLCLYGQHLVFFLGSKTQYVILNDNHLCCWLVHRLVFG